MEAALYNLPYERLVKMSVSWVGLEINGTEIESVIGKGAFSTVFAGKTIEDKASVAYKVARVSDEELESKTGSYVTKAKAFATSGFADIEASANEVINLQFEHLKKLNCTGLIRPIAGGEVAGIAYYTMPVISGQSMRKAIAEAKVSVGQLERVARTCAKIAAQNSYHGDLKPENIILSISGPIILDPGYFGPLSLNGFIEKHCAITTPEYYPLMKPDDLLALGIILWELVFGIQAFANSTNSSKCDLTRCDESIIEEVRMLETVGHYFYSAILETKFPRELNNDLSEADERFLLKSLRLRRSDEDKLAYDDGFSSVDQFADALKAFCSKSTH